MDAAKSWLKVTGWAALMVCAGSGTVAAQSPIHDEQRLSVIGQTVSLFTAVSRGEVSRIDNLTLDLMRRRRDGSTDTLHFLLTPQTERRGTIAVGTRVYVHYRPQRGVFVATSIQEQKTTRLRDEESLRQSSRTPNAADVQRE